MSSSSSSSSSTHDEEDKKNINAEEEAEILDTFNLVDGAAELPLPIGMAERISNAVEPPKQIGKVEIIEDYDGPSLPPAMMGDDVLFEDSPTKMAASASAAAANIGLEFVNELSPPTPFNFAEFEDKDDDALTKKMTKEDMMNQKPAAPAAIMSDEYSMYAPSRQDIEGDNIQDGNNINRGDGSGNRRGWGDIESRGRGIRSQSHPVQTQQGGNTVGGSRINQTNDMIQSNITTTDMQLIEDEGGADIHIPEAFLVDDISVYDERTIYDATPTLPWWKQRRTKIMLAVMLVVVVTLTTALGVLLSRPDPDPVIIQSGGGSNVPTISMAPSSSLAPSSSPSECALTVATNVQKLDMSKVDQPWESELAIDKLNAVVVTRERGTTNVHIIFYLLNGDRWERNNQYIEDNGFMGEFDPSSAKISVALSGKDALIGFPFTGSSGLVFVFEQNDLGVWEKRDNSLPIPTPDVYKFGYSVDIDGNLACVMADRQVYVYQNNGNEWKDIQRYVVFL